MKVKRWWDSLNEETKCNLQNKYMVHFTYMATFPQHTGQALSNIYHEEEKYLIDKVKGIFREKVYGEYAGATLMVKDKEYDILYFLNFSKQLKKCTMSSIRLRYHLAKCYLKYKSPDRSKYARAEKLVDGYIKSNHGATPRSKKNRTKAEQRRKTVHDLYYAMKVGKKVFYNLPGSTSLILRESLESAKITHRYHKLKDQIKEVPKSCFCTTTESMAPSWVLDEYKVKKFIETGILMIDGTEYQYNARIKKEIEMNEVMTIVHFITMLIMIALLLALLKKRDKKEAVADLGKEFVNIFVEKLEADFIEDSNVWKYFSRPVLQFYLRYLKNPNLFSIDKDNACSLDENGNEIMIWIANDMSHRRFYTHSTNKEIRENTEKWNKEITQYDRALLEDIKLIVEKRKPKQELMHKLTKYLAIGENND